MRTRAALVAAATLTGLPVASSCAASSGSDPVAAAGASSAPISAAADHGQDQSGTQVTEERVSWWKFGRKFE